MGEREPLYICRPLDLALCQALSQPHCRSVRLTPDWPRLPPRASHPLPGRNGICIFPVVVHHHTLFALSLSLCNSETPGNIPLHHSQSPCLRGPLTELIPPPYHPPGWMLVLSEARPRPKSESHGTILASIFELGRFFNFEFGHVEHGESPVNRHS
ncbi:hypothetical protein SODALDRAFT_361807 [Sodiomyces alkalinus F11]|uniref:Uncharacterized protein n=1 Tax=Sodiomyces alkalinus (strain CBS 110278 / VKM F-3762 / F11) TaxID=1314773 RepID=A0A3N2PR62_SODAK|nr:hypothetical protein SODALDRAFT_361807 [Sodiomyces alkalinus F11]ROT36960.1 hypothetical protein SODALDRAFT_361807 [Sodiomyces alkalinus F11]